MTGTDKIRANEEDSDADLAFRFFYVTGEAGTGLEQTTLLALVMPSLGISAALGVVFTLGLGLFYSHKIAGPVHRLKRALREFRAGDFDQVIRFRKRDELHDLAEEVTKTLAWTRGRIERHR